MTLLVSNVRGYIEFMETYHFDFNITIIRSDMKITSYYSDPVETL